MNTGARIGVGAAAVAAVIGPVGVAAPALAPVNSTAGTVERMLASFRSRRHP